MHDKLLIKLGIESKMVQAGFSDAKAGKINSLYNKFQGKIGHGKYDLLSHVSTDNDNRNKATFGASTYLRKYLSHNSSD